MRDISTMFSEGVNAYWSGELPDNWNDNDMRVRSPYLMGWWMASMSEVSEGFITDEEGNEV